MLSAALSNANGAAGTIYYHLVFTNTSATRSCTIQGYPGVSFVDGAGHQIGAPVPRLTSAAGGAVTLGPGSSAGSQFLLHDAYVGSVAGCTPTTAAGLRVYPPNQTAALSAPAPLQVCANPSTPGSGSIGPVTSLANLPG
ncbi:MAG: DUF4232 domain-containing protein [Actinomycetota bacterium]|nr:DUF4232 domain-containing protein [Actinomycetota bacterium]